MNTILKTKSAASKKTSQINKKPDIQIISLGFPEKLNSVLRNAEKQLIELLLTEAKVVSKAVEDKFEKKLREMFQKTSEQQEIR